MRSFSIDADNNATALARGKNTEAVFGSEAELYSLTAGWPVSRLVEIWNSIPGLIPVKKFIDRKTAVARIWKAIQNVHSRGSVPAADIAPAENVARKQVVRPHNRARDKQSVTNGQPARKPPASAPVARQGSKTADVLAMLRQSRGASLQQLMQMTGWQAHSVRGFISGTLGKKMRLTVVSSKGEDGQRRYCLTA
jgi:hypothetical protein